MEVYDRVYLSKIMGNSPDMLDAFAEYATRSTSLANIGILLTTGGAYRAYIGSLPEEKFSRWIFRRNESVDKQKSKGSIIFATIIAIEAFIISFCGAIAIAIGITAIPHAAYWKSAISVMIGFCMIFSAWFILYISHKPSTFIDRWQIDKEMKTWRSSDLIETRSYINYTGFLLIAIGSFLQLIENIVGQGKISLLSLTL